MGKDNTLTTKHSARVEKDLLELSKCKEEVIWIDGHFATCSDKTEVNDLGYNNSNSITEEKEDE